VEGCTTIFEVQLYRFSNRHKQQQDMKMAKSAQPPWNTSSKLLLGCSFHCPCHDTRTSKGLPNQLYTYKCTTCQLHNLPAAQIKNLTCYYFADCIPKKCSHIQAYAFTELNKAMPPICPLAAAAHMYVRKVPCCPLHPS
jgi:hypothetical protein